MSEEEEDRTYEEVTATHNGSSHMDTASIAPSTIGERLVQGRRPPRVKLRKGRFVLKIASAMRLALCQSAFLVCAVEAWGWKKSAPPSAPESAITTSLVAYRPILIAALTLTLLLALLSLWVKRKWADWYDSFVNKAFVAIDIDGNGCVDPMEFYCGVQHLYLTMNERGIICRAPKRKVIMQLMRQIDLNDSGQLNLDEFRRACALLSKQSFARAVTQNVLLLLTPMLANVLVGLITDVLSTVALPELLLTFWEAIHAPLWSPKLLTGLLLFILPPMLRAVDYVTEMQALVNKRKHL